MATLPGDSPLPALLAWAKEKVSLLVLKRDIEETSIPISFLQKEKPSSVPSSLKTLQTTWSSPPNPEQRRASASTRASSRAAPTAAPSSPRSPSSRGLPSSSSLETSWSTRTTPSRTTTTPARLRSSRPPSATATTAAAAAAATAKEVPPPPLATARSTTGIGSASS